MGKGAVNVNWVAGAVVCAGALVAFVATGEAAMLFLALAVAAFVVLGALAAHLLSVRTAFSFELRQSCSVGSDLALAIAMVRPRVMRGSVELVFECHNVFLNTAVRVPVTLAPSQGTVEAYSLPLDTERVGRVAVELVSVHARDIFGFAWVPVPGVFFHGSYTVYPDILDIEAVTNRANRMAAAGQVFDKHRKGQDLSEVFEMREFRDGDSMRSVHWKLSARFDDLMVREPSHPTDFDLVVALSLHARDAREDRRRRSINAAATMLGTVSRALLHRGLGHDVLIRNGSVLESLPVEDDASLVAMTDAALSTPLPLDAPVDGKAFASYCTARSITKAVLIVDEVNKALYEEIAALCQLTVIYVGEGTGFTVDETPEYTLMSIAAEAVDGRIKSLEL